MGSNQMPEGKPPKQTRFDQLTRVYTLRNEIEKNIKRGVVIEPHRVISLTSAEFRLLEALLSQYGNVVSHVELVKEIHGYSLPKNEAAQITRPIMCRLKSKLKQIEGADDWMMNIRGSGYLFELK
jgi:DNA-binding response OmpR family regulator